MQNMEKYYGFKVRVTDSLDAEDFELLKRGARSAIDSENLKMDEYYVYFHQLVVLPVDNHVLFEGPLDERVCRVHLEFSVNQKQRLNKKIRFLNHIIKPGVMTDVRPYYLPDEIGYIIPSSYFIDSQYFQNAIVTFIHKDIRDDHKKIKVSVSAVPTKKYEPFIKSVLNRNSITQLDLRFRKEIQLNLPFSRRRTEGGLTIPGEKTVINNHGGQVIVSGDGSDLGGYFVNTGSAGDEELSRQLVVLLKAARASPESNEQDLHALADAIDAAGKGRTEESKGSLAKLSRWILEKAESIGVPVAVAAIKEALKIGG